MKRYLISIIGLLFLSQQSKAIVTTWTGASGGDWTNAGNWNNGVPTISDDAVFNTSVTVVFTTSPVDFNSLTITNSSVVTFNTSATSTLRPRSTSAGLPALLINAGSSLTLNATNAGASVNNSALNMTFAGGVIGSIYGTLILSSSGASTESDVRLITSNTAMLYGIVTVYSGGSIIVKPNAGNTVSSLNPVPTIVMKNGSVYDNQKNGGSFPNGTWEATSLAKASSPGANGPIFNGTTYGNLEWNCAAQTAVTFLSSDVSFNNVNFISTNNIAFRIRTGASAGVYTMTVNGNLNISNTSLLEITSNTVVSPNGAKLHLKGHLNNAGAIITSGVGGTVNELELNGTLNQNIQNTGAGVFSGPGITFIMNNSAGAILLSPVNIYRQLVLTSGNIKTDAINILTLGDFASWTGGSSASFVEGPMSRASDNPSFTFPVGKGNIYAPIKYSSTLNYLPTNIFTAEYFRQNPQSSFGNNYDLTPNPEIIDHISYVEYWSLEKNADAFTMPLTRIELTATEYSFCKNMATTFVARHNDGDNLWKNDGTTNRFIGPNVPPYVTGRVQSGSITLLGIFTLATSDDYAANPLPINLFSFDARKLSHSKSLLNWELAACCSSAAKFEIQRAEKNRNFITVGIVGGSETNRFYNYTDNGLQNGINYYRLKMTDADGTITYSRTVAVMNGVNGLLLTSLIPTLVTNTASLTIASSAAQKMDIVIVDMLGRIMLKRNYTIDAGNMSIELPLGGLAAGAYQLTGMSAEGKTNTIRFIKQ
jgi:hypothetical protein